MNLAPHLRECWQGILALLSPMALARGGTLRQETEPAHLAGVEVELKTILGDNAYRLPGLRGLSGLWPPLSKLASLYRFVVFDQRDARGSKGMDGSCSSFDTLRSAHGSENRSTLNPAIPSNYQDAIPQRFVLKLVAYEQVFSESPETEQSPNGDYCFPIGAIVRRLEDQLPDVRAEPTPEQDRAISESTRIRCRVPWTAQITVFGAVRSFLISRKDHLGSWDPISGRSARI